MIELIAGLDVSRETMAKLETYAGLLRKWSGHINLVAPSTLDDAWRRHIVDSIQVFGLLPDPVTWVDLGSGAGFPGLVTAILQTERQAGWVHLIESNQKKAAFLRTVIQETAARATVHAMRADKAADMIAGCDAISARALAELDVLLDYGQPWMRRNPALRYFLHKGRDYRVEVTNARSRWDFDLVEHESCVAADSVILELANVSLKPS